MGEDDIGESMKERLIWAKRNAEFAIEDAIQEKKYRMKVNPEQDKETIALSFLNSCDSEDSTNGIGY